MREESVEELLQKRRETIRILIVKPPLFQNLLSLPPNLYLKPGLVQKVYVISILTRQLEKASSQGSSPMNK